ncbi:MAG TPA: cyclic nucleotide-binding domain-containing protein [Solirubrobacteraceae bacterium]|jgi:CRP-like cAMP-binding protein|nr:cyclic nucleotide-binding domain-containing protein [Solirubrobacteraceae bacterium]
MAVSIDDLREVRLLRGLKDSDLTSLAADLAERRVAAGDPIVGEGTGGVAFFFILEGETSVTVGGEEVATLGRGEYLGELALLDPEGPRSATVTARTDVVLAAMSTWQFRPFVLAHPEVAWTLLQRLARRLRDAQTPPVSA